MAMREYECLFADDTPFRTWRFCYDEDKGFHVRVAEVRLKVDANTIFADLSTPSGVQVLFSHDSWMQAMGRVTDMRFSGGKMSGVIELSEKDLERHLAGGFTALEAGVNSGLSAGFTFLDYPPVKLEKGEGTEEKPDKIVYGRLECREISLTAIPRLKNAGIKRRLGGNEPEPEPGQGDTTDE